MRDVMVHEMIHYYTAWNRIKDNGSHGRQFWRIAKEFNERYGLNITIKVGTPLPDFGCKYKQKITFSAQKIGKKSHFRHIFGFSCHFLPPSYSSHHSQYWEHFVKFTDSPSLSIVSQSLSIFDFNYLFTLIAFTFLISLFTESICLCRSSTCFLLLSKLTFSSSIISCEIPFSSSL